MPCSLMEDFRVVPSMPVTVSLRSTQTWWNFGEANPCFIIQQCCPPRTLLANGSTAVLAPNGKVSGPYARQDSVNETTVGTCFHICNPVKKSHAARVPPLAGRALRLASSSLAPFRVRAGALAAPARDPISYQSLVFSHIWLPRISIWNGSAFMTPSCHPPPLSFRSLPPDICTRMFIHDT